MINDHHIFIISKISNGNSSLNESLENLIEFASIFKEKYSKVKQEQQKEFFFFPWMKGKMREDYIEDTIDLKHREKVNGYIKFLQYV
jgi:Holliday junction resolvase